MKNEGTRDVSVQRYKGLGEMNAEQLWETTMNIETRTLLKVSLEDVVESDEIFTTLMGEDVEAAASSSKRTRWTCGIWTSRSYAASRIASSRGTDTCNAELSRASVSAQ